MSEFLRHSTGFVVFCLLSFFILFIPVVILFLSPVILG